MSAFRNSQGLHSWSRHPSLSSICGPDSDCFGDRSRKVLLHAIGDPRDPVADVFISLRMVSGDRTRADNFPSQRRFTPTFGWRGFSC